MSSGDVVLLFELRYKNPKNDPRFGDTFTENSLGLQDTPIVPWNTKDRRLKYTPVKPLKETLLGETNLYIGHVHVYIILKSN